MCFFSHILIIMSFFIVSCFFLHMICSFFILISLTMIIWTCASEAKCSICLLLHISCRPWFIHGIFSILAYGVCTFFTCFYAWLDILIKWAFGFSSIFMNKLGGELKRRSHVPTLGFNSFFFFGTWGVCM
jgi:hypothetical protein